MTFIVKDGCVDPGYRVDVHFLLVIFDPARLGAFRHLRHGVYDDAQAGSAWDVANLTIDI